MKRFLIISVLSLTSRLSEFIQPLSLLQYLWNGTRKSHFAIIWKRVRYIFSKRSSLLGYQNEKEQGLSKFLYAY